MPVTQMASARIDMTREAIIDFGRLVRRRAHFTMEDVEKGHHGDPEVARRAGLRGPVAYSLHYYAMAAQLLERRHGARWREGGELSMAFLRPVCAGDTVEIAIGARPPERVEAAPGDDRERLQVDVTNQLGELVAAGYATLAPV